MFHAAMHSDAPRTADPHAQLTLLRTALAPTYAVLGFVGGGGMGTVFLARDPALKRQVAVKVLGAHLAADPEARARFAREAQAVAALSHPNVVSIHAVGELPGQLPYFVMQFVEGRSLADRIAQDGPVTVSEARRILGEVASALSAAHAKGIIHRDIKPANVLFDESSGRALVSDFGLAAVESAHEPSDIRLTQSGMRLGTPQYMSPEQLVAEDVTERTDVYALGLLAYELLTGRGPFPGSTPQELIAAHLRDTPPRLAAVRADADAELDALVTACLEKDAAKRPTAAELARRLAPGSGIVVEWPPPGLESLRGLAWRHARWLGVSGGAVAVAFAALAWLADRLADVGGTPVGTLLYAALAAGALVAVGRARLLVADARRAAAAVRAGYHWRTVWEVAADGSGNGGALLAGQPPFAGLSDAQRRGLRGARVLAARLALGLAVATPVVPALAMWLALRGAIGNAALITLVLAAPVALLMLPAALLGREQALAGSGGRRRERIRVTAPPPGAAEAWYGAVTAAGVGLTARDGGSSAAGEAGAAARGAMRGSGRAATRGPAVAVLALLLLIAAGVIVAPVMLIPLGGPLAAQFLLSYSTENTERRLRAERVTLAYAPPVDAGITPLQAGEAYQRMVAMLRRSDRAPDAFERDGGPRMPLPSLDAEDAPFRDSRGGFAYPVSDSLFARARRGFAPDEAAWLREVADHPVWAEAAVVARAAAVDLWGARYNLPLPDTVTPYALPVTPFSVLTDLHRANVARAAEALGRGDAATAEMRLRESVGIARALASGSIALDLVIAGVQAGRARDDLLRFYELERPAAARQFRAARDSATLAEFAATPSSSNARLRQFGIAGRRRRLLTDVRDARRPVALRIEDLLILGGLQCSSLGEVLFGPSRELREAVTFFQDSVARYPSERAFVAMVLDTPERLAHQRFGRADNPVQFFGRWLDLSGRVLGSPRLRGCARWLGDFGQR